MLTTDIKSTLIELVAQPVLWDCSLASYTSFGIGGNAAALITVSNDDELLDVIRLCMSEQIQYRVIGRGTNLIISDEGFSGIILILGGSFEKVELAGDKKIYAGAATSMTAVNKYCIKHGLSGLEFSYGIPGTLGGAVVMNAGAWGGEIADVIDSVSLVNGRSRESLTRQNLNFDYRIWLDYYSKYKSAVVTGVVLSCIKKTKEEVEEGCRQMLAKRKSAQPVTQPNAGSFFKNPQEKTAGYLIDQCGLKGYRIGNVMVAREHANFFVNLGGGTAADVKKLMEYVQEKVLSKFDISLRPEVHFI